MQEFWKSVKIRQSYREKFDAPFFMRHSVDIDEWMLCVEQNVIDGDLCEMFNALDAAKQKTVAEELDRTPSEVKSCIGLYTVRLYHAGELCFIVDYRLTKYIM